MITGCLLIFLGYVWTLIKFVFELGLQLFRLFLYMVGIVVIAAIVSLIFRL